MYRIVIVHSRYLVCTEYEFHTLVPCLICYPEMKYVPSGLQALSPHRVAPGCSDGGDPSLAISPLYHFGNEFRQNYLHEQNAHLIKRNTYFNLAHEGIQL